MLTITDELTIPDEELVFEAIRAQGAGGQHVNKSSTAIQLRYDITNGTLPEPYRTRLLALRDRRITKDGVIVIKAQQHRSQEQNRNEALARLRELIESVLHTPKTRRATRPTRSAAQRRINAKKRRGEIKKLRQNPDDWT
jgi:ribosome-associated protein